MRWMTVIAAAEIALWLPPVRAQDSALTRPSHYAACSAWNTHIQDLIDQHRTNAEMGDDAFAAVLALFNTAKDACSAGRFEDAFHLYSIIPLSRPQQMALR